MESVYPLWKTTQQRYVVTCGGERQLMGIKKISAKEFGSETILCDRFEGSQKILQARSVR